MTDDLNFQYEKWKYDLDRDSAIRAHDQENDFFNRVNEAAIANANLAIRALIIINGGAAIATLAFISRIVSTNDGKLVDKIPELTAPLTCFAWGVALATLATALAYFTNYSITSSSHNRKRIYDPPYVCATAASKRWLRFASGFQAAAIFSALASLFYFVSGMLKIQDVISAL